MCTPACALSLPLHIAPQANRAIANHTTHATTNTAATVLAPSLDIEHRNNAPAYYYSYAFTSLII